MTIENEGNMKKTISINFDLKALIDDFGEEEFLQEMDIDVIMDYLKEKCDVDEVLGSMGYDAIIDYIGVKGMIVSACSTKCNEALLDRATAKKVMSELIDDNFLF